MPQHKSAEKRVRQTARRSEKNVAVTSKVKTLIKKVKAAKDNESGKTALKAAVKYLDQAATKGYIKKNFASNNKSKLTKFVNKLSKASTKAEK